MQFTYCDNKDNPAFGQPGHNPLHEVRPFIDFCPKQLGICVKDWKENVHMPRMLCIQMLLTLQMLQPPAAQPFTYNIVSSE